VSVPDVACLTTMANEGDPTDEGISQDKFLLHTDDPKNFLKLCTTIRILLHHQFTDADIDHADQML